MEEARLNRIGERRMGQGGETYMESALTNIEETDELDDVTAQYTGPSALWIANLITRTVRYRQGWFWTTTAICHGGDSQGLAFRQRPDGNGIDVRCHTRGCSRNEAIAGLEAATGAAIQSAYAPTAGSVDRLWPAQALALGEARVVGNGCAGVRRSAAGRPRVAGRHPQLPRVRHRLVADGSVAVATPCQEVLALTAGVSGPDHNPLNAKGRLLNGAGPSSLPASGRNRQRQQSRGT